MRNIPVSSQDKINVDLFSEAWITIEQEYAKKDNRLFRRLVLAETILAGAVATEAVWLNSVLALPYYTLLASSLVDYWSKKVDKNNAHRNQRMNALCNECITRVPDNTIFNKRMGQKIAAAETTRDAFVLNTTKTNTLEAAEQAIDSLPKKVKKINPPMIT